MSNFSFDESKSQNLGRPKLTCDRLLGQKSNSGRMNQISNRIRSVINFFPNEANYILSYKF